MRVGMASPEVMALLEKLGVGCGVREIGGGWTSERGRVGRAAIRVVCDDDTAVVGDLRGSGAGLRVSVVVEGRIVSPSYLAGMTAEQVQAAIAGLGWDVTAVGREVGALLEDGGAAVPPQTVQAWLHEGVSAEGGGAVLWALLAEVSPVTVRALSPSEIVLPMVVPVVPMSTGRERRSATNRELDNVRPHLVLDKGEVRAVGHVGEADVMVALDAASVEQRLMVFSGLLGPRGAFKWAEPGAGRTRHGRDQMAPAPLTAVKASKGQGDGQTSTPAVSAAGRTEPGVDLDVTEADGMVVRMLVEQRGPRTIEDVAACLRALAMTGREVLAIMCREVPPIFQKDVTDRWSGWMTGQVPVDGPMADAVLETLSTRIGSFYADRVRAARPHTSGQPLSGEPSGASLAAARAGQGLVVPRSWWVAAVGGPGSGQDQAGQEAGGTGKRKRPASQSPRLIEADLSIRMPAGGDGWFDLGVGVKVRGEYRALLPILLAVIDAGGLERAVVVDDHVRLPMGDGDVLVLPVDRVRAMLSALDYMLDGATRKRDTIRVSTRYADVLPEIAAFIDDAGMSEEAERLLADSAAAQTLAAAAWQGEGEDLALPASFRGTMRGYQRDGVAWLQWMRRNGLSGVLADDMGLGKTVQALAHVALEKAEGRLAAPALVVVPTSLVHNWVSEVGKFAPDLTVIVRHGGGRDASLRDIAAADLVVTTYGVLIRDADLLATRQWHLLILDEAQAIKNPDSAAAKAARSLQARHRVCMTGTPVENNLVELWSQFAFLMPDLLGPRASFERLYRTPIERKGDGQRLAVLKRRIAPYLLRRTKEQVATELPPKTEVPVWVEMGQTQRDLYETIRLSVNARVQQAVIKAGLARSTITVLDALLKLRQVCCDPRLAKGLPTDVARIGAGGEDLEEETPPVSNVSADAGASVREVESAKLDALIPMLGEMVAEGRRILLFSQFTSMLALIKPRLEEIGINYVELTGSTRDRVAPVDRFQTGEIPVFLISLKAGGRGLNLTAADTVIHYDPWWNPAVESQATDRAYRIGQDKPVFVYKLIARGTVEERILDLQARKGSLAQAVTGEGDAVEGWLNSEDVAFLLGGSGTDGGPADGITGVDDQPSAPVPQRTHTQNRRRGAASKAPPSGGSSQRTAAVPPSPSGRRHTEQGAADGARTGATVARSAGADEAGPGADRAVAASEEAPAISVSDRPAEDHHDAEQGPFAGPVLPVPQTGREVMALIDMMGIDGEQAVGALRQCVGEGWHDRLPAYWAAFEEERMRVPLPLGMALRDLPRMIEEGRIVLAPPAATGARTVALRLLTRRQRPETTEEMAALAGATELPTGELIRRLSVRLSISPEETASLWNRVIRRLTPVPEALASAILREALGK